MGRTGDPGSKPKSLACPHCGKEFSRPSHLSRHSLTHLPAGHKAILPCPRCQRTFARRDVLLRHLRTTHQAPPSATRRSAQKSCHRCVAKKRKCERTQPCKACADSHVTCEYPEQDAELGSIESTLGVIKASKSPGDASGLSPAPMRSHLKSPQVDDAPLPAAHSDYGAHKSSGPDEMYQPAYQNLEPTSNVISGFSPAADSDHRNGNLSQSSGAIPPSFQEPTPFVGLPTPFHDGFATDMNGYLPTNDQGISPSYIALTQPDFRMVGLDWLSFDMPDGTPQPLVDQTQARPWDSNASHSNGDATKIPMVPLNQAPPIGQIRTAVSSPSLRPSDHHRPIQPWPFDQTKDAVPYRYSLPPLEDILRRRPAKGTQEARRDALVSLLSKPHLPDLTYAYGADISQALSDLYRLLDLYFTQFHDIQPILHKATWNMYSCPTVLLTAMACVGALLSDDDKDREFSWELSDMCIPTFTWLGASDGTNYQDISYLNALCLHQIYSLGSGSRSLYQNADRSRGTLVGSLRGIGLLSSHRLGINDDDFIALPPNDIDLLNREWAAWITREQENRAAWAAFEYDCSLCTLTSRRGAVDLSELPRKLPCGEALWSATSAQAWLALRSRLTPATFSPGLSATLKDAMAGKPLPTSIGTWARRLCAQVIGRLLWDLKQLEVVAMPEHFGLPSLLGTQQRTKKTLLYALNNLLGGMSAPSSTPELISYNICGLLCHYSHIYASEDVIDTVVYMVRNHMSPRGPKQQQALEVAQKRLSATFTRDVQRGRELLWHAAQIVAIANEYLVSAPCEIMRVFMAYIFVLAYSSYGPHTSPYNDMQPIQLDVADHQDPAQSHAVGHWIKNGGPASMGTVRNICAEGCVADICRDAQDMLQRLSSWGLAEKFTKILHIFEVNGF